MQWWNDFVGWLFSDDGWRVISTVIVPFVAILVAGLIAAAIGRGSTKRLLALNDRQQRAAAVTAMIGAARRASVWNTLSASEQRHADYAALEADIRLRLLSVPGAGLASDWCAHEIATMKKNAVSFSFQAEQSMLEFRNRLIDWHTRPSRAKKLFKNDLDSWAYDTSLADEDLVAQQQAWARQQSAAEPDVTGSDREPIPVQPAATTSAMPPARTPFAPAATASPLVVSAPIATPPDSAPQDTRPFQRQSEGFGRATAEPSGTGPIDTAQSSAAAKNAGANGESHDVDSDRDTDSDGSFPPPVSVSQVRERITPSRAENDELR